MSWLLIIGLVFTGLVLASAGMLLLTYATLRDSAMVAAT